MIPNIIKTIIKDIPSVANSSIRLMNENRDRGQKRHRGLATKI